MTYGLKIVEPGKDTTSTDLRDIIFNSNYSMFKYHSETSPQMTINAGDTTKTISFAHGLSYVPAFISYIKDSTGVFMLPMRRSYFTGFDEHYYAYADATNIYITWKSSTPHGQSSIYTFNTCYNNSSVNPYVWFGHSSSGSRDSGLQYKNVAINRYASIASASLNFYVSGKGTNASDVKINIWGIGVDNLSDFGSDLGKTKTSATHSQNISGGISVGSTFGITVTNEIQEIVNRSGWSSGNALGFYLFNNGTDTAVTNYFTTFTNNLIGLTITLAGSSTLDFKVIVFKDRIA